MREQHAPVLARRRTRVRSSSAAERRLGDPHAEPPQGVGAINSPRNDPGRGSAESEADGDLSDERVELVRLRAGQARATRRRSARARPSSRPAPPTIGGPRGHQRSVWLLIHQTRLRQPVQRRVGVVQGPRVSRGALAELTERVAWLVADQPLLAELDLNHVRASAGRAAP